jgi:hypothetical protein
MSLSGTTLNALTTTALWNAASLQGRGVATTTPASGEVLKWNGTNWSPSTDNGASYTAGTGMSLSGTTLNALTTTALWNAASLQGRAVSSATPTSGQILSWNGTAWAPSSISGGTGPWTGIGSTYAYTYRKVGIGIDSADAKLDISDTISGSTYNFYSTINSQTAGATNNLVTTNGLRLITTGRGGLVNNGIVSFVQGTATTTYTGSGATAGYFEAATTAGQNNFGVRAHTRGASSVRSYAIYAHGRGNATFNMGVFALCDQSSSSTSITNYGIYAWADSANTNYAGYFAGNVTYTGTLASASDRRLKKDIRPMESVLAKLSSLEVKTYNYDKTGIGAKLNLPTGNQFGFIAQDLEKSFPELVTEQRHANNPKAEEGEAETVSYKAVNYIGMIPILTKAIQEQQDYIKKLEDRILQLEKNSK